MGGASEFLKLEEGVSFYTVKKQLMKALIVVFCLTTGREKMVNTV